jgi:hypothetical protein
MMIRRFLVSLLAGSFLAVVAAGCGDSGPKIKGDTGAATHQKKSADPDGGSKPVPD